MPRSEKSSSGSDSESDSETRARRLRKKSKFADPEDMVVQDFLASVERGDALPAPGPPKAPPPLYFDVRKSATEREDLLGRLDISGAKQLTFGRDATKADIPLEHPSISRHHATMTFDRENAFIADIRSTHGTFLTRKSGGEETRLKPAELTQLGEGDAVRFGESPRLYEFGIGKAQPRVAVVPQPIPCAPGVASLGDGNVRIQLHIPHGSIARLTGLQGRTIMQIQERTGAQIHLMVLKKSKEKNAEPPDATATIAGTMDSVASARLELLAITQLVAPPAFTPTSAHGTQRFRYSSTIVHGAGDDEDLNESGTAPRRVW